MDYLHTIDQARLDEARDNARANLVAWVRAQLRELRITDDILSQSLDEAVGDWMPSDYLAEEFARSAD
jgi:hypothetical protein